jgi:hypothetical protein
MNDKQIWQTIALDLKRAANYLYAGKHKKADYYLKEAKNLYKTRKLEDKLLNIKQFIKFEGHPEDILLGSNLIVCRL